MPPLLLDAIIVYVLGLFLVPNLGLRGRPKRWFSLIYGPAARIGLWYRWSMYSPEVPDSTRIGLAGVRYDDGSFEVIPLPGFDDGDGFGKARHLRFIAFQLALCAQRTDHLKPAFAAYALRRWRSASPAAPRAPNAAPVALELRELRYPSPEPGERADKLEPEVRLLWTQALKD